MNLNKFNNEYSIKDVGKEVSIKGFVQRSRNLGGLIFIDLRDRSGILQVLVKPDNEYYELASTIKSEYVLMVKGTIVERSNKNKKIENGDIEVELDEHKALSKAIDLPFELVNTTALEDTRLKYRYLDIRREKIKNNLVLRHNVTKVIRNYLDDMHFIEVETPILTKSTPEGARDYLVPSRVYGGRFYALPQSPQLFKQLLMVGGIERYYQLARCFRDEDLRADRQPEFTQLDIEMSYIDTKDVMKIVEGLVKRLFKDLKDTNLEDSILKIKYNDAINEFGSDKPDLRFDLKINDITDILSKSGIDILLPEEKEQINCLVLEEKVSRKEQDKLVEFTNKYGLDKLFFLKYENKSFAGSLVKNLDEQLLVQLRKHLNLEKDATIIIGKGEVSNLKKALGALRLKLGKDYEMFDKKTIKPVWIVDFPLFEYDVDDKRYYSSHHPFTAPLYSDHDYIDKKDECYSKAYDLVINGYEVCGGSIRISDSEVQSKIFDVLGLSEKEKNEKFGFLLEAFEYGVPPHGGVAFGLERLVMLLAETENIKDVIAFPKTSSAQCLMTEAPSSVCDDQLKELSLKQLK